MHLENIKPDCSYLLQWQERPANDKQFTLYFLVQQVSEEQCQYRFDDLEQVVDFLLGELFEHKPIRGKAEFI